MVNPVQPAQQETTPEVLERSRAILRQWQGGDLTYQDAVEQFTQLQLVIVEPVDKGHIENQLGIMQGYRGNHDASAECFERARELFIEVGNRRLIANCTMNLGETYRLKGNYTRARQFFNAAYEAAVAVGMKSVQVIARTNEAQTFISQGRCEPAATILKECYQLCLEPWENPETENSKRRRLEQICEVTYAQAWAALELGKIDDAWNCAAESLKFAQEHNTLMALGQANRILGEVVTMLDEVPDAAYSSDPDEYFKLAMEAFREIKADGETARTLLAQGKSLSKRGDESQSSRKLQQATVIFTRLGMMDDAAKAAQAQLKLK